MIVLRGNGIERGAAFATIREGLGLIQHSVPVLRQGVQKMLFTFTRPSGFVRRTVALSAILGASVAVMSAQTSQSSDSSVARAATQSNVAPVQNSLQAKPTFNLDVPVAGTSSDALFSSSNTEINEVADDSAAPFNFVDPQYGGGHQRYGRPRYRGGNTNADGSNKFTFYGGAGLTVPTGNTHTYLTPSYSFQVGGGPQFSKHFALPIEFDWDNFGFQGRTLANQTTIYNTYINLYNQNPDPSVGTIAPISNLDGSSHVWSFSIDPTYTFYSGEGLGAYVVAGVGFYHKTADFTVPALGEYCDPFYGCYTYSANQTIDHYTSNAPGFNAGLGLTYKLSRFSNERFYGEVRYVFVDNSQRAGVTAATASAANVDVANDYPANSNHTSYFPIKFGVRF
jgi:hypothetical protein